MSKPLTFEALAIKNIGKASPTVPFCATNPSIPHSVSKPAALKKNRAASVETANWPTDSQWIRLLFKAISQQSPR